MRISDWSSDVCSSDLDLPCIDEQRGGKRRHQHGGRERGDRAIGAPRALRGMADQPAAAEDADTEGDARGGRAPGGHRVESSEEHTSELPSLMRNSYDVFRLQKTHSIHTTTNTKHYKPRSII